MGFCDALLRIAFKKIVTVVVISRDQYFSASLVNVLEKEIQVHIFGKNKRNKALQNWKNFDSEYLKCVNHIFPLFSSELPKGTSEILNV